LWEKGGLCWWGSRRQEWFTLDAGQLLVWGLVWGWVCVCIRCGYIDEACQGEENQRNILLPTNVRWRLEQTDDGMTYIEGGRESFEGWHWDQPSRLKKALQVLASLQDKESTFNNNHRKWEEIHALNATRIGSTVHTKSSDSWETRKVGHYP